jgi:hypothetical protein
MNVPVHHDAETISFDVVPIPDKQPEYSSLEHLWPVALHDQIRRKGEATDEKFCWLMFLYATGSAAFESTQKITKYDGKQKSNPDIKYRRMYYFADLRTEGKTCIMFERGREEQKCPLRHITDCRRGDMFALLEPEHDNSFLNTDVPIFTTRHNLIPVNVPTSLPPQIDVRDDTVIGSTSFFIIHGATLALDSVLLHRSICGTGHMCDLSNPTDKNCACWFQSAKNGSDPEHVLVCNVNANYTYRGGTVPVEKKLNQVKQWSSQLFTELVFDGRIPLEPLRHESDGIVQRTIRRKLNLLVTHINQHNGFTLAGWYKKGAKQDATDTAADDKKVATRMEDCRMHLIKVWPTSVTKTQLEAAGLLLPVAMLGESCRIDDLKEADRLIPTEGATKRARARAEALAQAARRARARVRHEAPVERAPLNGEELVESDGED